MGFNFKQFLDSDLMKLTQEVDRANTIGTVEALNEVKEMIDSSLNLGNITSREAESLILQLNVVDEIEDYVSDAQMTAPIYQEEVYVEGGFDDIIEDDFTFEESNSSNFDDIYGEEEKEVGGGFASLIDDDFDPNDY